MNWFLSLLLNDGIAHTVFIYAFVIVLGVSLGKVKICGVSLGIAFVLFAGIACGHFGLSVNETLLEFIREFGLILFVFAVGLQVGPSFFSSFKKEGLQMNIVAVSVVLLDIIVTIILMLREIGICLFLASVGIGAGAQFFETVVSKNGLLWLFCGFLITVLPLIIVVFFARKFAKFNYLTLLGVLSGSRTNPPLLAYSSSVAASDAPAVGYSTVYPLTMFLRILSAQVLILAFYG